MGQAGKGITRGLDALQGDEVRWGRAYAGGGALVAHLPGTRVRLVPPRHTTWLLLSRRLQPGRGGATQAVEESKARVDGVKEKGESIGALDPACRAVPLAARQAGQGVTCIALTAVPSTVTSVLPRTAHIEDQKIRTQGAVRVSAEEAEGVLQVESFYGSTV